MVNHIVASDALRRNCQKIAALGFNAFDQEKTFQLQRKRGDMYTYIGGAIAFITFLFVSYKNFCKKNETTLCIDSLKKYSNSHFRTILSLFVVCAIFSVFSREKPSGKETARLLLLEYSLVAAKHYSEGDYLDAMAWHERARFICEKEYGQEHLVTVAIWDALAGVYALLGNYAHALELYKQELPVLEKIFGQDHENIVPLRDNIAFCERELNLKNTPPDQQGEERLQKTPTPPPDPLPTT